MHSKIHNLLYSEDPPPNQDGSTSGLPQSSKAKESTKGKGSSKGKGKAKAAAAVEEVQWQDDRDENAKFNEAEPSPFDDRRKKELEKALKLAPAAEFRAGWQLFVADLMSSDKVGLLRFDSSVCVGLTARNAHRSSHHEPVPGVPDPPRPIAGLSCKGTCKWLNPSTSVC